MRAIMQRARAVSVAKLALLGAAAMLLTGAREHVIGQTVGPSVVAAPPHARRAIDGAAISAEAKRFAAKIKENLPRVADPRVVEETAFDLDNDAFRNRVVRFVREIVRGRTAVCALPPARRTLRAVIWLYRSGVQIGRGEASSERLCTALKDATRSAIAATGADAATLGDARLVIDFPDAGRAIVEHDGHGVEVTEGLVPVRLLDAARVRAQIAESRRYLQSVVDPARYGAHKFYHASTDLFEDRLHTIYTASTALTFLKLHARSGDPELLQRAERAAIFMSSMQNRTPGDRARGGFFYSFDTIRARHDETLVVGTTAKSIFTLLELHRATGQRRHLDAAIMGADWLVTMQRPDGSVRSSLKRDPGGSWASENRESLLYTGQVLSALSRVHRVSDDRKYLDAAARTAGYLAARITARGCHLGDEYRAPNPISSSWVVLSLLDFVRTTHDEEFERLALRCADDLLGRQVRGTGDVLREGSFRGSLSSSGNGWLAEVMSEVHLHCRARGLAGCERFRDSVAAAVRLLAQYTYSPENAFVTKNPEGARGGLFWSRRDSFVRTDAVCHATNAYLNVVDHLAGFRIELREPPLADALLLGPDAPAVPPDDDKEETDE